MVIRLISLLLAGLVFAIVLYVWQMGSYPGGQTGRPPVIPALVEEMESTDKPADKTVVQMDQDSTIKPTTTQDSPQAGIKQRQQSAQVDTKFLKISWLGKYLENDIDQWYCAESKETGLVWEVKRFDGGLRDNDSTYSWYSGEDIELGKRVGRPDGGSCYFSNCDSFDYVNRVNAVRLCGASDWRLPSFRELETLLDRDYYNPVINQSIFIHARPGKYMTSTELEANEEMIMYFDFFNGMSLAGRKDLSYFIRLVRSGKKK